VVEGHLDTGKTLQATAVLAKHDENYMPREVVEALKQTGEWQHSAP
jgi:cytochrome c-type biogenesis protein CcmE